jgi:hypothetical protein
MKNPIDSKYKELLANFNNDSRLQKIMNYFDKKQILNDFSADLFLRYHEKKISKKVKKIQKASRFPLINQRLLLVSNLTTKKIIEWIVNEYHLELEKMPNYEAKETKKFSFSQEQLREFFSFHQTYNLIASVYTEPFKNLTNYPIFKQFYYYLVMYINLELSFNKFIVNDDYQPFLLKLEVQ